ncbi:enoyl-CoA hydratase/isomerase [Streptomyces sp. DSM 44915]|uniref:Enoyl-CoA hydratase/isomerase n=1 Tax=Streptomyces chisholmiae TaxID=3075540 RepID=A0ABU2JX66_9ACTN|nr:enoyl-CoA hydratase/isomerase [Streptomyces sp. DSM 44915]MDT0269591.1 enoyl-CoA hydratase/isomerase [Streptomyces sp. DSM 44915]UZD11004.1 enoyl-CoA hydratase [Marinispora sp. CNQ-140]
MDHETIRVRRQGQVCRVRFDRPERENAINDTLVRECHAVLDDCARDGVGVVVFEGSPEVFCVGADFTAVAEGQAPVGSEPAAEYDPAPLFDLWLRMATGPFVTVAHVRGKTNAGGVGFVAASDVAIADTSATFGLSELLFGLYPAMVLPFLTRRVGFQRANYLTLTTRSVDARQAAEWGLVDACAERGGPLLAQHLGRLGKLSVDGIARYKRFMSTELAPVGRHREPAIAANLEIFSDPRNLERITRFVEHGIYPWEQGGPHPGRRADEGPA